MTVKTHQFLKGTRAYLSGPMDFVADRATEKRCGWRVRMKAFLQSVGVTVFDPWEKPRVRGLHEYGLEDVKTVKRRDKWSFEATNDGAKNRAELAEYFWETMHVDLRMVDLSDFVVAYCPTSIYSVGTVHEIVVAREQHKPVLLVSPPVAFPALSQLEEALAGSDDLLAMLADAKRELPAKENPSGIPSLWYMTLIGSESFFDGFGFCLGDFHAEFPDWKKPSALDVREQNHPPRRPLLPFLAELARGTRVPRHWDHATQRYRADDDWLLLEQALR